MLTSEGTINRSTHIINDKYSEKLRFLTPVEAELLNEFPKNWTKDLMTKRMRYFTMGNALVVGIVRKISVEISKIIDLE
jgi:DNA (cytosine-5)-methyltransferase 1